jgi:hypothetical protein
MAATTTAPDAWLQARTPAVIKAWAERVAAGAQEGKTIPNAVRKFCGRHSIDADRFGPMAPVGRAVARRLRAIDAAKEVAP